MVGFCHLTDSHHYHHGQKPTMVGICHGGNMPVGRDYDGGGDDLYIVLMRRLMKIHHFAKMTLFLHVSHEQ